MWYEHHTNDDEVRFGRSASGFGSRRRRDPSVLVQVLQEDLHPTSTLRHLGGSTVPQDRLSRHRTISQGLVRSSRRVGVEREHPRSLHHPEGPTTPAGKKRGDTLLSVTTALTPVTTDSLVPQPTRAAIDATGLESRHASRHFYWRAGRRTRRSTWPKLTAVIDIHTHIILAVVVSRGPGHDGGQFRPAVRAAVRRRRLDTLLGDAAYDAEHIHAYAREDLGIRSTVFPVYRRGGGRGPVQGKYRSQMVRRFRPKPKGSRSQRIYGQRWQAESAISRHKRRLGSALRARLWPNQRKEILLRVIVHNLMILAAK
jgi:Transposase DDE domain